MLSVKGGNRRRSRRRKQSVAEGKLGHYLPLFLLDVGANKWYSSISGSGLKCALGCDL